MPDTTSINAADTSAEHDAAAASAIDTTPTEPELTTLTGLTLSLGRTPRGGLAVTAYRDDPNQPAWWILQTGGRRTPAALVDAVVQAATRESDNPASFESMDQAIGQAGAGWRKSTGPCAGLEGATRTQWTSPGGLRSLSSSDLSGLDVTGYMTGWILNRTPVNRLGSRTWRISASTPEAVICALALTSVPKCQITDELLETLSGLELSPAAQAANKMFVGVRRTDSVLSRTIGSIVLDSGRWAGNVLIGGHEQRLPGTSCCVQHAMAAVWTQQQA